MDLSRRTFLGMLAAGTFVPTLPMTNGGIVTNTPGTLVGENAGETIIPKTLMNGIQESMMLTNAHKVR